MCGLAGVMRLDGAPAGEEERAIVARMLDTIAHRGPDDRGLATLGPVCLGAVRLAILDLSPRGHMPMAADGGRALLVYNGEVYNFRALRADLAARGVVFASDTDTEVVLQSLRHHGEAALARLRGMFAFAFFDARRGALLLVRDRYGVKPLYFAEDRGRLLFASELKALLPHLARRRLDREALGEWWLYRNLDALAPRTLVAGVEQLPAGHLLRVDRGRVRLAPWYDLLAQVGEQGYRARAGAGIAAILAELEERLEEAVRLRLVADVPVGVLLSGGLDSSLLAALAARERSGLAALHVSVQGYPRHDERPFAEEVARRFGLRFIPLALVPEDFRRALPRVAWLQDLPLTHPNAVAYFRIAQKARAEGVIVLLSGEGADELFGGYAWSHRRRRLLLRLRPWLARLPGKLRDALTLLAYGMEGLPVTAHRFREALPAATAVVDRGRRAALWERALAAYGFLEERERVVLAGAAVDLLDFLAPLLRRLDRTTMGASVECREPFLDPELVHFALALPAAFKAGRRADKWVLKRIAVRHLPRSLVHRPKMGFPLPLADYLAPLAAAPDFPFLEQEVGLSRAAIAGILRDLARHPYGAFGLFALELWGRIHLWGEAPERAGTALALR